MPRPAEYLLTYAWMAAIILILSLIATAIIYYILSFLASLILHTLLPLYVVVILFVLIAVWFAWKIRSRMKKKNIGMLRKQNPNKVPNAQ